ncbi:hypothetical protein NKH94_27935 [Mesorhizobium australicum]|uniref:hypothetical protein n=1 Tax=Mesorhizobium australicum TaxID=536018 RepID=UPI0033375871
MKPYHSRPIRDYAFRLFTAPATDPMPEIRLRVFTKTTRHHQEGSDTKRVIERLRLGNLQEFRRRRVLQTGPHLLLFSEPEAYYTHIFSLLGLPAHGCSTYVSYAVSTVNLVEKPRKGPGWLTIDGKPVNVFGLSRSRMIGCSLLAGPGPYTFQLLPTEANNGEDALTLLRSLLPKTQFERPAHAIEQPISSFGLKCSEVALPSCRSTTRILPSLWRRVANGCFAPHLGH